MLCKKLMKIIQSDRTQVGHHLHDLLKNTDACKTDSHQVGELVLVCGRVHDPSEVDPVERLQGVDDDEPVGGLELFRVPYSQRVSFLSAYLHTTTHTVFMNAAML